MATLFVNIIGHNASGKTTLAKKLVEDLDLHRINGDEFRQFISENFPYFKNLDMSLANHRFNALNPLVVSYRIELSLALLANEQSTILEGSGFKKQYRDLYLNRIKKEVPGVKTVIILVELSEEEVIGRLKLRDSKRADSNWQQQYEHKKQMLEPPTTNEADVILIYNQLNYEEIRNNLSRLISS